MATDPKYQPVDEIIMKLAGEHQLDKELVLEILNLETKVETELKYGSTSPDHVISQLEQIIKSRS